MEAEGQSSNTNPNRKDPAWKYCHLPNPNDTNRVKCLFCGKETNGGIYRAKLHLIGGNRNAKSCNKCPENVKNELSEYMDARKKLKENYDRPPDLEEFEDVVEIDGEEDEEDGEISPSRKRPANKVAANRKGTQKLLKVMPAKKKGPMDSFVALKPERVLELQKRGKLLQSNIKDKFDKQKRDETCQYVGRMLFRRSLPFNICRYDDFKLALIAVANYGPGFRPPSYHEMRTKILRKEVEYTKNMMNEHRAVWKSVGCSIMSDGWTSRTGLKIINFLVSSLKGSIFFRSIDATKIAQTGERLFRMFDSFVDEVGEENVVQLVTDNGANFKLAGKLLQAKRQHLFWTPCAAHCIDLMLEDIGEKIPRVKNTLAKAIEMTGFFNSCSSLKSLLRSATNNRELIRPAKTRFATSYLTLKSIYDQKNNLRNLFEDPKYGWAASKWSKTVKGKRVFNTVRSLSFWRNVAYVMKIMGPLVKVLRIVDNERKPAMDYIYEDMDRAKEAIAASFKGKGEHYEEAFKFIDERWEDQLHQPLHAAGYLLNPAIYYDKPSIGYDSKVMEGFFACVAKLVPDMNEQDRINSELSMYQRADKLFGSDFAIRDRKRKAPAEWWSLYGSSAPSLQQFAIRILSLTCSSSACERNWSAFEQCHTKRRSGLAQQTLNDLVFVQYNQAIKDRYNSADTMDPISLGEIDESNEWLVGKMGIDSDKYGSMNDNDAINSDEDDSHFTGGFNQIGDANRDEEPFRNTRSHAKGKGKGSSSQAPADIEEEDAECSDTEEEEMQEYKTDESDYADLSVGDEDA